MSLISLYRPYSLFCWSTKFMLSDRALFNMDQLNYLFTCFSKMATRISTCSFCFLFIFCWMFYWICLRSSRISVVRNLAFCSSFFCCAWTILADATTGDLSKGSVCFKNGFIACQEISRDDLFYLLFFKVANYSLRVDISSLKVSSKIFHLRSFRLTSSWSTSYLFCTVL